MLHLRVFADPPDGIQRGRNRTHADSRGVAVKDVVEPMKCRSCGGNIPLRSGRETRVPPWSPEQQRWAPSFDPVQVWPEKTKSAFDRRSRCGTEVSRRLADQSRVPAMGPAAQPSPAVRSVEEQRVSSDRVSLFELLPDLESQERTWLSPQPGAS